MKANKLILIGGLILVGGWLALAQTQPTATNQPPASAVAGSTSAMAAPRFALRGADNQTVRLSDFRGKGLLVAFLLTSAAPCQQQVPALSELQTKYGGAKFSVLGLILDEGGTNAIQAFASANRVNFPLLVADYETIEGFGGLTAVPTLVLVEPSHRIVKRHVGITQHSQLDSEIKGLLGQ